MPLVFLSAPRPESLKDLVAMEVDGQSDVKSELPTPPASDVGSPTSFSHCGSDSEPDSPMGEDTKVWDSQWSSLVLVQKDIQKCIREMKQIN